MEKPPKAESTSPRRGGTVPVRLDVTPAERAAIRQAAAACDQSMAQWVREVVLAAVKARR